MGFQKKSVTLSLQHRAARFELLNCARIDSAQMTSFDKTRAVLTDSHFLIPLIVFCIGLALLITLR